MSHIKLIYISVQATWGEAGTGAGGEGGIHVAYIST